MRKLITLLAIAYVGTAAAAQEVEIPRSIPGDKGRYYLISSSHKNGLIQAVSKRVGVEDTVFSKVEINCRTRKMRGLGESYTSVNNIKPISTDWFDLVEGSSKSDLTHYLCDKK